MEEIVQGTSQTIRLVSDMLVESEKRFEALVDSLNKVVDKTKENLKQQNVNFPKPADIKQEKTSVFRRPTRSAYREAGEGVVNSTFNVDCKNNTVADASCVELACKVEEPCRSPEPTPSAIMLRSAMQTPVVPSNARLRKTCRLNKGSPATEVKLTATAKKPISSKLNKQLGTVPKVELGTKTRAKSVVEKTEIVVTHNEWTKEPAISHRIMSQMHIHDENINRFFMPRSDVDLKELFPNICASKLQRNSSVHWASPKSYSKAPDMLSDNRF